MKEKNITKEFDQVAGLKSDNELVVVDLGSIPCNLKSQPPIKEKK
jgi:hypothetical protein